MADTSLTVVAASVLPATTYGRPLYSSRNRAGATITAGTMVYFSASSTWLPINVVAGSAGTAVTSGSGGFGIAANGAASGQIIIVQTGGGIKLNTGGSSTIAIGEYYRASQVATGGMASMSGFAVQTGNWTTIQGYGVAADTLTLGAPQFVSTAHA